MSAALHRQISEEAIVRAWVCEMRDPLRFGEVPPHVLDAVEVLLSRVKRFQPDSLPSESGNPG